MAWLSQNGCQGTNGRVHKQRHTVHFFSILLAAWIDVLNSHGMFGEQQLHPFKPTVSSPEAMRLIAWEMYELVYMENESWITHKWDWIPQTAVPVNNCFDLRTRTACQHVSHVWCCIDIMKQLGEWPGCGTEYSASNSYHCRSKYTYFGMPTDWNINGNFLFKPVNIKVKSTFICGLFFSCPQQKLAYMKDAQIPRKAKKKKGFWKMRIAHFVARKL